MGREVIYNHACRRGQWGEHICKELAMSIVIWTLKSSMSPTPIWAPIWTDVSQPDNILRL